MKESILNNKCQQKRNHTSHITHHTSNKGITIISLIITIVLMLILASVTINIGSGEIEKAKLEDLKTTMLLIKGRAQIVADKESFGEEYNKEGMLKIDEAVLNYDVNDVKERIFKDMDTSNLYLWEQTAMDNNNIDVEISKEEFYIIDYATGEVYYSLGYAHEGIVYYSLTDIQKIGEE